MGIMVGFDGAKVASNGNCGFFIVADESKLGTINVPIGGIVKLQDSGKMLERTANGYVEYSGGGGGGSEKLQGYFDGSAWQQSEEEKALNAQLYAKIVSAIENDQPISVWMKVTRSGNSACLTSTAVVVSRSTVMVMFFDGGPSAAALSSDGSVSAQIGG